MLCSQKGVGPGICSEPVFLTSLVGCSELAPPCSHQQTPGSSKMTVAHGTAENRARAVLAGLSVIGSSRHNLCVKQCSYLWSKAEALCLTILQFCLQRCFISHILPSTLALNSFFSFLNISGSSLQPAHLLARLFMKDAFLGSQGAKNPDCFLKN